MNESDIIVKKSEVEEKFLGYLDWFYRDECSDEIESVIKTCDRRPDNDFEKAWCDLEDQDLAWLFIDMFALNLRPMLEALVLQRREEEKERSLEMLDRMGDLHGTK